MNKRRETLCEEKGTEKNEERYKDRNVKRRGKGKKTANCRNGKMIIKRNKKPKN